MGKNQYRWLILIEEKEAIACLVADDGSLFLSKKMDWNGSSKDDLLVALDTNLGECLTSAGLDQKPKEAVFVLSPFWVDDKGEVLGTRKQILKEVCQSFSISPLGFLIGEEVLAQRFDSFVSVYFSQNHLRVSLVKSGEILVKEEVETSLGMEPKDLVSVLEKIRGEEPLPAKLVFWGLIDQEIGKKLADNNWKKEKVFSQPVSSEVVSWEKLFNHFSETVSGQAVSRSEEGQDTQLGEERQDSIQTENDKKEEDNVKAEVSSKEKAFSGGLDFGFVDDDIVKLSEDKQGVKKKEQKEAKKKSLLEELPEKTEKSVQKTGSLTPSLLTATETKIVSPKQSLPVTEKLGSKKKKIFLKPFSSAKKIFLIMLIPLVLAALSVAVWYFSKVRIEIFITPEKISKEIEVQMDPAATKLDSEKGIIPVEDTEIVLEAEKSGSTTGQKLIGEKSSGSVTIYNRTSEVKLFEAGTVLAGPGGLKFVLDNEVQIASKTPDLVSGVDRWGEVDTSITSDEIGAEHNLASQSVFSIGDFSEDQFLAKNAEPLSGGTSRQIRAVSEGDRTALKRALTEELKVEAEKKSSSDSSGGRILKESLRVETVSEKYTADIGEEKDTVGLTLKLKFLVSKLSEENLVRLGKEILEKEVSEGLVLDSETISVESTIDRATDDGIVVGNLLLTGKAYPSIDLDQLSEDLKLSNKKKAQEIIRSHSRVYRFQTYFQPSFLEFLNLMPPQASNIMVEIKEQ